MTTTYTRVCTSCKERKPGDAFSYNERAPDGCQSHCKVCQNTHHKEWARNNREEQRKRVRRSNFKQRHKITGLDDWVDIQFKKQQGICAMVDCNKRMSDNGHALCVDHNHTTNKLRALLCRECNLALDWYEKNKHRHAAFDTYKAEYD